MELIIKNNNNNHYRLKGTLVKLNVYLFDNEFKNIFDNKNSITINITELDKIDIYGVIAISKLHNEAIARNKRLSVIGQGGPDIFKHSNQEVIKESVFEKLGSFVAMPFL